MMDANRIETFEVEVLSKESLKDYLIGRKHPRLVSAILEFIEEHFMVKIGDILKIMLEFDDYHGKICYITVKHFVSLKIQENKRLNWSFEEMDRKA